MEITKVTPRTLPGFMELLPNEQILFNEMKETIKNSYEQFGFLPLDTPAIELSEVLLAKAGGETEKQIYRFTKGDTDKEIDYLVDKIVHLRIFDDENGVMNRSVADVGGEVLAVSQFTLNASTRKGNRPSYIHAAGHDIAIPLYDAFCDLVSESLSRETKKGVFGADMQVALVNDGPVTIIIDSKLKE